MFGLAQSQKMDGKSFCRNFLDLVWFSAYVVCREVGVSLPDNLKQRAGQRNGGREGEVKYQQEISFL